MTRLDTRGCRGERPTLLRYVDDELDAMQRISFEDHLVDCPSCAAALQGHLRLEEMLHQDVGIEPDRDFDDRIVAGVFARIDGIDRAGTVDHESRDDRSASRRVAAGVGGGLLTAAALLLVLLRSGGDVPPSGPSPDRPLSPPTAPDIVRAVPSTPATPPSETSSSDDAIVPARLAAARATVDRALSEAEQADDYRAAFRRGTAPLMAESWPVDEIVIRAIDDDRPAAARRAIRASNELSIDRAVPALRRAARRGSTADVALVALGALGDEGSLDRLERGLRDPLLRQAAADGLALLATPAAARVLGRALSEPALQETAERALLRMGTPSVAELLRLRAAGDLAAARTLYRHSLPTADDTLRLLDPIGYPTDVVAAALSDAAMVGARALPRLRGLLSHSTLGVAAADAMVLIGGPEALRQVAAATLPATRGRDAAAFDAFIDETIRRLVRATSATPSTTLGELFGGTVGERLLRALDARTPELATCLAAVFADRRIPADRRATAALALAEAGRFDAAAGLAAVFEIALVDDDAAARVLCAAARAGAGPGDAPALAPLARSVAARLLRRATVVATRWEGDDEPPLQWERQGLAKLLAQSVPRL